MPKAADGSLEAWVLFARIPRGLTEAFPTLVDGDVLAVLPVRYSSRASAVRKADRASKVVARGMT